MTDHSWVLPEKGPGRLYQQSKDLYVNEKFDNTEEYVQNIAQSLRAFMQLETAVRFLLDGPHVNPAETTVSIPFEGDADTIYTNLATLIYFQLWGYYLAGDPKTTHHGLTNLVLDGEQTSLVRREAEKFLGLVTTRNELGGRMLRNYRMACDMPEKKRDVYLKESTHRFLDIHLGVRIYTFGEGVERKQVFLPIAAGAEAIDHIYYNLENIIHQNFIAYDEVHDHYLPVTEELIAKEVEGVIDRAKHKENTRKKLINGLKVNTVLLEDPAMNNHISLADFYYDKLNRIDLLNEASQRSRELFATGLIRSSEIVADAGIKIEDLQMEERVFIEKPAGEQREAATVPAGAPASEQEESAEAPAGPATNGLTEL